MQLKTTCCNAPIAKSAMRKILYCKKCKRVLNDDLFTNQGEQTCVLLTEHPSTKTAAQNNSGETPEQPKGQT